MTISNSNKLIFISNLGTMLSSGIPILEAIQSINEESKGNLKKVLDSVYTDLSEGKTLSVSLSKFPKIFDPVATNLLKASEEAGTLDQTLKDLSVAIKQDMEFKDKIKAALTYPLFVVGVFIGIFFLILGFVMPRIGVVFARLNVKLPLPTKILLFLSGLLLKYTVLFILICLLLVLIIFLLYKFKQKEFIRFLSNFPLVNKLARQIDLTRFTRSLALLLSSGIPIVDALDLTQNIASRKEIVEMIKYTKDNVSAGQPLSKGFKHYKKILPAVLLRITEAGERSGNLEKNMQELSEYLEVEVSNTLKALTTLLEPILLVLVGLMVGGIMLSIIAPIYQLIGNIKGR